MFIIIVTFTKPLKEINQYLSAHRRFLDECYENDFFIASGQNKKGSGGVIISQIKEREKLEEILSNDPLSKHALTSYQIIEFTPTKHHKDFSRFVNTSVDDQYSTSSFLFKNPKL